ncbi:hypothetical protein JCM19300_220 [Algibacter lectus]|uniref:Uncharacterized protein n=1 Tax=Algibacter lectus TaxID=221126 RepID=A0A090VM16_9FLAO|nr:hypothetical protein JCM19300_220 [Algibacter lectus]
MDEFLLAYKSLITSGVEVLAAVTGLFFFLSINLQLLNFLYTFWCI